MSNWCWWCWSWFKPPHAIFFEASCNIHDQNYENWVNEKDRKKADKWLFKYMKRDIKRLAWYKQPRYYIWCILYYVAVRLFGWKYFNYK